MEYWFIWKYARRAWYWCKRKKRKFKYMWNRFKWCVIGGLGYALGRYAFYYLKDLLGNI